MMHQQHNYQTNTNTTTTTTNNSNLLSHRHHQQQQSEDKLSRNGAARNLEGSGKSLIMLENASPNLPLSSFGAQSESRPARVRKRVEFNEETTTNTYNSSSSQSLDTTTPQRSQSETPPQSNTIQSVLAQVHRKMANKSRKLSPRKVLAKQKERQQRAEQLRAQIEMSRKDMINKVKQRQEKAKTRHQEAMQKKRIDLHQKLQQAARKKEAELANVVERARTENVKVDESNFYIKLTKQNQQLDLSNKLTENEERRKQQHQRDLDRIKSQELKRNAADQRRKELEEEMQTKILSKEQKREQADQRRREQRKADKNRARQDKIKRDLVRARKNEQSHRISDIMSFVSKNNDSLWQFIGMEDDLEYMGLTFDLSDAPALGSGDIDGDNAKEDELLRLIQRDQFELEKLMLKRDQEILNTCISFSLDGTMKVTQSPLVFMQRQKVTGEHSPDSIDSTSVVAEGDKRGGVPQSELLGANRLKSAGFTSQINSQPNSNTNPTTTIQAPSDTDSQFKSPASKRNSEIKSSRDSEKGLASSARERTTELSQHTNSESSRSGLQRRLNFTKQKSHSFQKAQEVEEEENQEEQYFEKISADDEEKKLGAADSSAYGESTLGRSRTSMPNDGLDAKIRQQNIKMAMKRNLFKRNISEDLDYADCIKNPSYQLFSAQGQGGTQHHGMEVRSVGSSPERTNDTSLEDLDEMILQQKQQQDSKKGSPQKSSKQGNKQSHTGSKKTKNKGKNSSKTTILSASGVAAGGTSISTSMTPIAHINLTRSNKEDVLGSSFGRVKRGSFVDQTAVHKSKRTLSNCGSCSSLSSLIKQKNNLLSGKEQEEIILPVNASSNLNQTQLDQLGPVQKMPINGFPFLSQSSLLGLPQSQHQNIPSSFASQSLLETGSAGNGAAAQTAHQENTSHSGDLLSVDNKGSGLFNQTPTFSINSLIVNHPPVVPLSHHFSSVHKQNVNLSKNGNLYLYPIKEQKIILMIPDKDKEFNFAQARIQLSMQGVMIGAAGGEGTTTTGETSSQSNHGNNVEQEDQAADMMEIENKNAGGDVQQFDEFAIAEESKVESAKNSPTNPSRRAEPLISTNLPPNDKIVNGSVVDAAGIVNGAGCVDQQNGMTTPKNKKNTSSFNQNTLTPLKEQPFTLTTTTLTTQSSPVSTQENTSLTASKSESKEFTQQMEVGNSASIITSQQPQSTSITQTNNNTTSTTAIAIASERGDKNAALLQTSAEKTESVDNNLMTDTPNQHHQQHDQMVNLIVKKLLIDSANHIRVEDSQKTILLEGSNDASSTVLRYLEVNELHFKYCRLCQVAIHVEYSFERQFSKRGQQAVSEHFQSKGHTRKRENLNIKEAEDLSNGMILFSSQPGDIEQELKKEREKALKRKAKNLKQQIVSCAVVHENASTYPAKELSSKNKNRLQVRAVELEKSVFPQIKNYDTVYKILNDVINVLDKRQTGDLDIVRKLKYIPTMIDMCKRISVCPKGHLKDLAKALTLVIRILTKFCNKRENRNYMLQTNRMMPLIELFYWCLQRQTELFFGIDFVPGLLHILTSHLKHRVPFECQQMKELLVDYLISSQIPLRIKSKLAIVKAIQSNEGEEQMGQVPFFLLKSVSFLEALTAIISVDARTRPVYERSYKIGEHVFFVLHNTELLGVVQSITTLLLTCNEPYKASQNSHQSTLILPQTILSLAIVSIKTVNNMMRMDLGILQLMLVDFDLHEQLYHLLNFILSYTEANLDQSDDVKELLHETLLFIGYFCLLNEQNQTLMHRGENSILQKLCNLPFTYFMDREKKLKEILFPTIVAVSYQNQRSLAILDQEMDVGQLVKYMEVNIAEELPRIMEQEQEYFSDHTKSISSFGRRGRSPGQSSTSNSQQSVQMDFLTGSNPYIPLVMRFPKTLWKDAVTFFKSVEDFE